MEKWMVCLFLFVAIVVGTEAAARTSGEDAHSCNKLCAKFGFVVRIKRQDSTQSSSGSAGGSPAGSSTGSPVGSSTGSPVGHKKRCVCYDYEGKLKIVEDAEKYFGLLPLNEITKLIAKRILANKK